MKPACQHCKKFFGTKHGRNIHEFWCPNNPTNIKFGAPPAKSSTDEMVDLYKEHLPKLMKAAKMEASQPQLNYCPNCSFEVRNLRAFDKAGPNYCPNCGVHLDNIDLY